MKRPWWHPILAWLDGYWHIYVCNAVERYVEDDDIQEGAR